MKLIERAGWMALAAVLGPMTNEIAFVFLNSPGGGVNVYRAAIPAIAASAVSAFCILKALGFFRKQPPSQRADSSDATTRTTPHSQTHLIASGNSQAPQQSTRDRNGNADDELVWAQALQELEGQDRRLGLWARLYTEAKGDEAAAKAAYLHFRVAELLNALDIKRETIPQPSVENSPPESSAISPSMRIYPGIDTGGTETTPHRSKHPPQPTPKPSKRPVVPFAITVTLLSLIGVAAFIYKEAPASRADRWWQTEEWSDRVSILRRKIVTHEIPEIPSALSEFNANAHVAAATIPIEMVQSLEATQTWWTVNGAVFIHLDNTTPFALAGFEISFSESHCNLGGPVQRWAVTPSTVLAPGGQAVLSFDSKVINSGCLIIESAWR